MTFQVNKLCEISSQIKSDFHEILDLTTIYNNPIKTRYDESYDKECMKENKIMNNKHPLNSHRELLKIMTTLVEDRTINTDECIVATTQMNTEFPYLIKKLRILNAMLNSHFNKKFQRYPKYKHSKEFLDSPEYPKYVKRLQSRIKFFCFNEKSAKEKTHSHMFLRVPENLNFQDVVNKMQELFLYLDDRTNPKRKHRFRIHHETIDDQFAYCEYSLKDYSKNT